MKAKIIIVEDHEPIRNELKILLSKYGYEIIVLDRFDTVVEDCLREDVDLILLDINLPFYDGYYVCRAIREKSEVPIIVVTSRDSEMDELMSINLGADDFYHETIQYTDFVGKNFCNVKTNTQRKSK